MYTCVCTSVYTCVYVYMCLCVYTDNGSQCVFDDSETQGNSMECGSGGSQPNITRTCLQRYFSSLCFVSHEKVSISNRQCSLAAIVWQ